MFPIMVDILKFKQLMVISKYKNYCTIEKKSII